MEDARKGRTTASELQHHQGFNGEVHVIRPPDHVRDSTGAKYKFMSPAKLPIPRPPPSNCITIPPGLSPTSFLDSPVLLSNVKAEPSPTTGSFSKTHLMPGPGGTVTLSLATNGSNSAAFDDVNSSGFELKLESGSNSASGVSITPVVISGFSQLQSNPLEQVQDHCQSQSLGLLSVVKCETVASSNKLSLSAPVNTVTSGLSIPVRVDSDELNQKGHIVSGVQTLQSDHKDTGSLVITDRSSDDGYNWRKYGQKLVKGCEFPRSYYKCTYPNCEVKKTFERSHDGQITEIVYKGMHDHPKPQSSRRFVAGAFMSIHEGKTDKVSSFNGQEDISFVKDNSIISSQTFNMEQNGAPLASPRQVNDDSLDGLQLNNNNEVDEDDPISKWRKLEASSTEITPVVKPIREPRVVVQTISEVDILDDGYRWRKYGQKVVRGNPNPRSYYKCTNAGCPVRKHVERASHDPKAVITTYEGKHNHDIPAARTNNHDSSGPTAVTGMSRIRAEQTDTISLALGVGISHGSENRTFGALVAEPVDSHIPFSGSNLNVPQASVVLPCYGVINGPMNLHGSRDNRVGSRSFETLSLHHSNQYPQNLGRILLGP